MYSVLRQFFYIVPIQNAVRAINMAIFSSLWTFGACFIGLYTSADAEIMNIISVINITGR